MQVYLDNAASSVIDPEIYKKWYDYICQEKLYNPSSSHFFGQKTKVFLEEFRNSFAKKINSDPKAIFFTSGATESNNLILYNALHNWDLEQIWTSPIEHASVLSPLKNHNKTTPEIKFLPLNRYGAVDVEKMKELLANNKKGNRKTLISITSAHNELGTRNPIEDIAKWTKNEGILFHSDMVQSFIYDTGKDLSDVDFISVSGHKFHSFKGIGVMVNNSDVPITLFKGGAQERGKRPGTQNIEGILSLKIALEEMSSDKQEKIKQIKKYTIEKLTKIFHDIAFNGDVSEMGSVPHILNVRFPFTKMESLDLVFRLNLKEIATSFGSACSSGLQKKSEVLSHILSQSEDNSPSIRLSFSKFTTTDEIDYLVSVLKDVFKVS